jgi:lipopolysaccharide transport system ATP-binding protein
MKSVGGESMQPCISVVNLCKHYQIAVGKCRHDTLRDQVSDFVSLLFRSNGHPHAKTEIFWALKDVSFQINPGEVVGVIGKNGAGKSTLLKVLSRITRPSAGIAEIRGRVGSLLEVGTGFHAELTGRENIYLNGAILGMKKAEIGRKFDEIVEFAGLGKFVDTPVKRYSSGMYVRLGFAVAAHLEPEIMIVDEVLSVGDAAFQKKCLGKMEGMAHEGRTVLFVSHNMLSVQSLCTRVIVLKQGTVGFNGTPEQAVIDYLISIEELQNQALESRDNRVGGEAFRFASVHFLNPETMAPLDVLVSGQPVLIRIGYVNKTTQILKDISCGIAFFTLGGVHLCAYRSRAVGVTLEALPSNGYTECLVPRWPLSGGRYLYHLTAEQGGSSCVDWLPDAGSVQVESGDYFGTGFLPSLGREGVFVDYTWKIK